MAVPINDLTVLLKNRDKTVFWRAFYAALPQGDLFPSTMVTFQLPRQDLLMPVVLPVPPGRPPTRRIPNVFERGAGQSGGGSPGRMSPSRATCGGRQTARGGRGAAGGRLGATPGQGVARGGIAKRVCGPAKCSNCGGRHYLKTCPVAQA